MKKVKSAKQFENVNNDDVDQVRLDKWLWAARFCRTRSIARDLVQSGKVQYNNQRTKPSKLVELGATVKIPAGFDVKTVIIKKIEGQRKGAQLAQLLYEETAQSIELREKNAAARRLSAFHSPKPDSRPDKKQRRQIIKFKQT